MTRKQPTDPGDRTRTSCLINNRNYEEFVCEAVESAIEQQRAFDEIVVVDDGSTDNSVRCLRQRFGSNNRVRIVAKQHAGQLSCFHTGAIESTGDILFFLDADDRYCHDYLSVAMETYTAKPAIEFLSVARTVFGPSVPTSTVSLTRTRDCGISTVAAILQKHWVGNPTSCLSLRRPLVEKILPYPHEKDWMSRADDILVLGSSIAGAHKYHLGRPLVQYRLHENNSFAQRSISESKKMKYLLAVNRLIRWYTEQNGYDRSELGYLLPREFQSIERPGMSEWLRYLKMGGQANLPLNARLGQLCILTKHYLEQRFAADQLGQPTEQQVTATNNVAQKLKPAA